MLYLSLVSTVIACAALGAAQAPFPKYPRQAPADPSDVTVITSPNGAKLKYSRPGEQGVCETSPGVDSYSGYISLNESYNMFFYFFEARNNVETAPITLWLNGGPGSDSLIGLFQELGPCNISADLNSMLNPYSWNEVSNLLFLSQPIGVGFSYESTEVGYWDEDSRNVTLQPIEGQNEGRHSVVDPETTDTTYLAAIGAWEVLQAFYWNLPKLDMEVKNRTFNLWTESYGGHYGPTFYRYFSEQNDAILNGTCSGVQLQMDTLGIINGMVDELIQAPYYPEFARNNTYGIEAVNETVYEFMNVAYYMPGGCRDRLLSCHQADRSTDRGQDLCVMATYVCRRFVEGPYYDFSGRGVYDIRQPYDDPTPPDHFIEYLNLPYVQSALGVSINYTTTSSPYVNDGFWLSGDSAYPRFKTDLEELLNNNVRVSLVYGDADYVCNWFGGEALSLALNYDEAEEFAQAGYAPFLVDGEEYGVVREYGRFSFMRIYNAGHLAPYYQPKASLEFFRRILNNLVIADGRQAITDDYSSPGAANATRTQDFVPLPAETGGGKSNERQRIE